MRKLAKFLCFLKKLFQSFSYSLSSDDIEMWEHAKEQKNKPIRSVGLTLKNFYWRSGIALNESFV